MRIFPTIGQQWEAFAAHVLPADVSPIQRQEMRRAYYAGVFYLLAIMRAMDESVSNEEGVAQLEAWQAEVEAFYVDMKAGKV